MFIRKTWLNRKVQFPNRRILIDNDNNTEIVYVQRQEGTISQVGDSFSAENMNGLEARIEAAFSEVFHLVSDGKKLIADAITDKGVLTSATDTYQKMADNIRKIITKVTITGNATAGDVMNGRTFYSNDADVKQTGTLTFTGNAIASQILNGKTVHTTSPTTKITGSMINVGSVYKALGSGESYTIPQGYHDGGGVVIANSATNVVDTNVYFTWDWYYHEHNQTAPPSGPTTTSVRLTIPVTGTYILGSTFRRFQHNNPSTDYNSREEIFTTFSGNIIDHEYIGVFPGEVNKSYYLNRVGKDKYNVGDVITASMTVWGSYQQWDVSLFMVRVG